jgi:hypothetical protein
MSWFGVVCNMTFIGRLKGVDASSLHAQYFEEYVFLSDMPICRRAEVGNFYLWTIVSIND